MDVDVLDAPAFTLHPAGGLQLSIAVRPKTRMGDTSHRVVDQPSRRRGVDQERTRCRMYPRLINHEGRGEDEQMRREEERRGSSGESPDGDAFGGADEVRAARNPGMASRGEYEHHMLKHMPSRARCAWCLPGRGRCAQHRCPRPGKQDEVPIIVMDFCYLTGPSTLVVRLRCPRKR